MHVGVCSKSAETAPAGALNSNLTAPSAPVFNTQHASILLLQDAESDPGQDANLQRNNELSWRRARG